MSNNNSLKDFALSVLSTIGTELSNDEYEHRPGKQKKMGFQAQNLKSGNNPIHRHSFLRKFVHEFIAISHADYKCSSSAG